MIWNIFAFFNFVSIITPPVLKIIEFPLQHLIAKWKEKRLLQNKFSTYVPGWCYNLSKQMCVCLCKGVSDLHVPYLTAGHILCRRDNHQCHAIDLSNATAENALFTKMKHGRNTPRCANAVSMQPATSVRRWDTVYMSATP